jgi:acetyl-CoA carboxylase biotin carboxyl carrier protein
MGDTAQRVEVRAPMSGVFYRSSSPDKPAYVEEGDVVKKKQILALLELEIKVENETPLKDDDLMFVIEKG